MQLGDFFPTASLHPPLATSRLSSGGALGYRTSSFLHLPAQSRSGFTSAGLRCKVGQRGRQMVIRCEAVVAKKAVEESSGEKFEYQAEVSRLLDLIVHSLYSHKEVFFRELASNASDALDKLSFLSVTDSSLISDAGDLEIRIKPDPDNGTITIIDTGIGMTKEELIDCLGTIAQSGTSRFLKALKGEQRPWVR